MFDKPANSGGDGDKTLSRYQELGKSGELCLAGSDQGQGTWGKGGKKNILPDCDFYGSNMININILPVCDVIGRCPLNIVRGNLFPKKAQLSVLVVMGLSQIKTNCTQGIPGKVGGNSPPKMTLSHYRREPGKLGFDVVQLGLAAFNGHLGPEGQLKVERMIMR